MNLKTEGAALQLVSACLGCPADTRGQLPWAGMGVSRGASLGSKLMTCFSKKVCTSFTIRVATCVRSSEETRGPSFEVASSGHRLPWFALNAIGKGNGLDAIQKLRGLGHERL